MVDDAFPVLMRPDDAGTDAAAWAAGHRDEIGATLRDRGALLLRGLPVGTPEEFDAVVSALSTRSLEYTSRSSPRHNVFRNVYTSTDYPANQTIFQHNESSYSASWPARIFFFCDTPAESGGATPLSPIRAMMEHIDPTVLAEFERRGVLYVRTFREDMGLSWQTAFGSANRAEVAAACSAAGMETRWLDGDVLQTRQRRPAVQWHPDTGEKLWFNHVAAFHVSTLGPAVAAALIATYGEDQLPNNAFYGDGAAIEPDVLDHIRSLYLDVLVRFDWERGDVLVLDNMTVAHGRDPFTGPRRILVAMADPRTDAQR